jgi:hypothetical protein
MCARRNVTAKYVIYCGLASTCYACKLGRFVYAI